MPQYEDCSSCPTDCGSCNGEQSLGLALLIDPRNCLSRNFSILTYDLWDRATCDTQGLIVFGKEVCKNESGVKVEVYQLKYQAWEKIDEYISDADGVITFVPTEAGEFKLVGTKRGFPTSYQYLEIGPCIEDEAKTQPAQENASFIIPETKPAKPQKNETRIPEEEMLRQAHSA